MPQMARKASDELKNRFLPEPGQEGSVWDKDFSCFSYEFGLRLDICWVCQLDLVDVFIFKFFYEIKYS